MAILKNNLKEKYTKIPNNIILSSLSNESFRLLVYLYSKPNNWKIYQERIGKDFKVTRQTINNRFKELKEKCFVEITQYTTDKGTFDYKYTLLDGTKSNATDTVQTLQKVSNVTDTVANGHEADLTHNNTDLKKDLLNNKTDTSNNVLPPYKEIVDYLNITLGSAYKHTTPKTRELINARFNEGFLLEDFKYVVLVKFLEWNDDNNFSKFLTPNTLFSNKFEKYRNQKMPELKKKAPKINKGTDL